MTVTSRAAARPGPREIGRDAAVRLLGDKGALPVDGDGAFQIVRRGEPAVLRADVDARERQSRTRTSRRLCYAGAAVANVAMLSLLLLRGLGPSWTIERTAAGPRTVVARVKTTAMTGARTLSLPQVVVISSARVAALGTVPALLVIGASGPPKALASRVVVAHGLVEPRDVATALLGPGEVITAGVRAIALPPIRAAVASVETAPPDVIASRAVTTRISTVIRDFAGGLAPAAMVVAHAVVGALPPVDSGVVIAASRSRAIALASSVPPLAIQGVSEQPQRAGLLLVVQPGESLEGLYDAVYRGLAAPGLDIVMRRNPGQIHAGSIVVFPAPANGWRDALRTGR